MAVAVAVTAAATGVETVAAVAVVLAADQAPHPKKMEPAASGLFFCLYRSVAHKQGHQRVSSDLTAPVAMHRGIKCGAFGQRVGRVKELTRPKDA